MISKRYQLLLDVISTVEKVKQEDGYIRDLDKVYKGRTDFGANDGKYFATVLEVADDREKPVVSNNMEHHVIPFFIQGFVDHDEDDDGLDKYEMAYEMLADIQKALRPEIESKFGRDSDNNYKAVKVDIAPGVVMKPSEGSSANFLIVIVKLDVTIVENFTSPYP